MDYTERIKNAFRELSAARGFSRVTVDELAAHAGISKRTIYRYFNSKEEIISSVLDDFKTDVEKKIQQALDTSDKPLEKILNALRIISENARLFQPSALYDLQKYYPHLWEEIEQFRAEKIRQFYVDLLVKNENNYFRKVNPKIFAAALLASVRSVVTPGFIMENNLLLGETIESLFSIFMYGIISENAREREEANNSLKVRKKEAL